MKTIRTMWMSYLRSRALAGMLGALSLVTIALVYRLYDIPTEPRDYTVRLIASLYLAGIFIDLFRFRTAQRRADNLRSRAEHEDYAAIAMLSEQNNPLAATLAARLDQERTRATEQREREQEYLTMWLHQIKNPIAGIKLALQDDPDPEQIEAAILQIEHYVEMAIHQQRMARPSRDIVFEPVSLHELVSEEIERLRPMIATKNLDVTIEIEPGHMVVTDAKWLGFAISQLLINAIKYTYTGGITVSLNRPARPSAASASRSASSPVSRPANGEGEDLVLEIRDTGIGIAAEDLPQLFQWGYTGNTGRIDKRSTGIGLYLCKQILTMLGFAIELKSHPGSGTTVSITLQSCKMM
ncbi:MAG: HAMP domain-containing sensor histidine kinase [Bacillota bacterium]|nr:HAMP domain-containing sensor histidine kinase [Bacillota bacterium]